MNLTSNMLRKMCAIPLFFCMLSPAFSTTYCAHGGGFLKIGMNLNEVRTLCGPPLSQVKRKISDYRNIQVQQLFYTLRHSSQRRNAFNNTNQTEQKINLQVNVISNKVLSLSLNNTATQGVSICPGGLIQVGSALSSVLNACGSPNYVNTSFKKIRQGGVVKQEVWTIKATEYDEHLTLTFKDGQLTTIE